MKVNREDCEDNNSRRVEITRDQDEKMVVRVWAFTLSLCESNKTE